MFGMDSLTGGGGLSTSSSAATGPITFGAFTANRGVSGTELAGIAAALALCALVVIVGMRR